MTQFFLDISADLLLEIFESQIFEIIAISFLFVVGLSAFNLIKRAV